MSDSETMAISSWFSKIPGWVFIMLAAGGAGYLWLRQHDRAVRAEGRAEELGRQADSLRVVVREDSIRSARRDEVIDSQHTVIEEQKREIIAQEVAVIQLTSATVAGLRNRLPADLQTVLDSVVKGYEQQLALKDEQIALEARKVALERERVASRDSTIDALRRLNASIEAEVVTLRRETKRSVWDRIGEIAPWAAAAYALGSRNR